MQPRRALGPLNEGLLFAARSEDSFGQSNSSAQDCSALHYSLDALTDTTHYFDLEESKDTYLMVNYKVGGIGSNSCGPKPEKQYLFNDDSFDFDFHITTSEKE